MIKMCHKTIYNIVVILYEQNNHGYIMSKFNKSDGTPGTEKDVVKIYNSQMTSIEDEIELLKNTDKYNL